MTPDDATFGQNNDPTISGLGSRPAALVGGRGTGPGTDLIHNMAGIRSRVLAGQAAGHKAHRVNQRDVNKQRALTGMSVLDKAAGEEQAGQIFARLGPDWTVLHDVPIDPFGTTLPHVLVGPSGVYTVDTKNLFAQKVFVFGSRFTLGSGDLPFEQEALDGATFARQRLHAVVGGAPVHVQPIVLIVNGNVSVSRQPDEVMVLTHETAVRWLQQQETVYSPDQVTALSNAARDVFTWLPSLQNRPDPQPHVSTTHALGALPVIPSEVMGTTSVSTRVRNMVIGLCVAFVGLMVLVSMGTERDWSDPGNGSADLATARAAQDQEWERTAKSDLVNIYRSQFPEFSDGKPTRDITDLAVSVCGSLAEIADGNSTEEALIVSVTNTVQGPDGPPDGPQTTKMVNLIGERVCYKELTDADVFQPNISSPTD